MDTQKNNFQYREAISAAMDGEAPPDEWQWLDDVDAHARWNEYHIIRDSLRASANRQPGGGLSVEALAQLSDRLQQVRQDAPAPVPPQKGATAPPAVAANQPFFKWFAMVASVAAVSVGAWQLWPQQNHGAALVAVSVPMQAPASVVPVAVTPEPAASVAPEAVITDAEINAVVVLPAVQKQPADNTHAPVEPVSPQ